MKTVDLINSNAIIRIISGTALTVLIFAGASFAAPIGSDTKTNHDLAHYAKVADKDTTHVVDRSAVKSVDFTDHAAKDTGKGIGRGFAETGKTVKRGGKDTAHYAKVSVRETGRGFRRAGHIIV